MGTGFNSSPGYISSKGRQKTPLVPSSAALDLRAYDGKVVHVTGTGTVTKILPPPNGECLVVFDAACTLTHSAASLILPSAANITTAANDCAMIGEDGAGNARAYFYTKADGTPLIVPSIGDHEVVVHTGNGHGSTNTNIRRFTTTMTNSGTAITYADSATNGASFTINDAGLYAIHYSDFNTGSTGQFGISLNSSQWTTNINSITVANRLAITGHVSSIVGAVSRTVLLAASDVIRPHTDGAVNNANDRTFFAIRKVGK